VDAHRLRLRIHPPALSSLARCLRPRRSAPPTAPACALRPAHHDVAPHPRVYSTNRLSKKSLHESFGPFPSRAAAERYCDAVLDLFLLRRCYEDLAPYPEHPGCVYGEMNKCMQPCKEGNPQACTPEQYAHEASECLHSSARAGSRCSTRVAAQREAASEAMDFEGAATLHKQWEKVRAASMLADELVRPLDQLRA
jgi:excinuclease ABC subunit C